MSLRIVTSATLVSVFLSPAIAHAEDLTHLRQLLSTQTCPECNLTNAGLVRAELVGAQLQGANLTHANLSRANLSGADLTGADLTGASLQGANLSGANLTGATLKQTDLRNAYLKNVQLENTTLETAYIRGAIGVPTTASSAKQFYQLAVAEAEARNYKAALKYSNLAINLDPEYASAYLGRGVVRYRLGDQLRATQDAEIALELFTQQENKTGIQASQQFMKAMEIASQPRDSNGGGGGLNRFFTTVGSLLMRFFF